jgi:hypothetical protein
MQWLSPGLMVVPAAVSVIASIVGAVLVIHAVFLSGESI